MKKILFLIFTFILFLPSVSAETETEYTINLLGRSYQQIPFTTGYSVGEITYYTNNIKIYGTNLNLSNLPKYLYFVYCANGDYDLNTTQVNYGGISNYGSIMGGTCTVGNSSGNYYLNRWLISSWSDLSSSGVYAYGVEWKGYPINQSSYYSYLRGESVFLSNELITSFGDTRLLTEILNKNNTILNSVNTSSSSINNNINNSKSEIIAGQNSIRDSIIQNQNENTDKQIDSQKVCNYYSKDNIDIDNKYLTSSGSFSNSEYFGITDYIDITNKSEITVKTSASGQYSPALCFYGNNKNLLSCILNSNLSVNQKLTIPNKANYVRFSIAKNSDAPTFEVCEDGNQANNNTNKGIFGKLKDLFSFFNNDDIDSDATSDTFDDLNSSLPTNSVISDLLLLPVRLLQAIVNSLGGTCSSFNLGTLYGTNLVMPCIDLQSYLGNTIWTFIDLVFSGMFILVIRKKFIQIWENITNLRNGGNEVD